MKRILTAVMATVAAAVGTGSAFAQNGPLVGPDAEVQMRQLQQRMMDAPGNVFFDLQNGQIELRKEKAAYLGTSCSPTDATTREQLKLPRGVGLTVDFVDKDSPAAAAELAAHDVLTKLDDQWLINMPQMAVLVRMHKPGDAVKVTYIRGGESKTAVVKLVEKEVPVLEENPGMGRPLQIPFPGGGGMQGNVLVPRIDLNGGPAWQPAGRMSVKTENGVTTKTMTDAEQSLTLMIDKEGKKTLSVENKKAGDPKGDEIVFSGPVDTDEQKGKLPAGVGDKLKRMESGGSGGGLMLNTIHVGGGMQIVGNGGGHSSMAMSRSDGEHTLELRVEDGDRHLVVKDKDGKVIFDGPVNTQEERKKLPEGVAAKLEKMQVRVGGR